LIISFGVVGSFLLFISTIMLTALVIVCLCLKCCLIVKPRIQGGMCIYIIYIIL
jgi:hypothetical protein